MVSLVVFIVLVLVLQIVFFFMIRARRKKEKESSVIEKYNIKSPGDAFKLMNDMTLPKNDRLEIERLYQGKD